jgi:ribosomal protein S18 acetylase RimI-like enzyme
LSRISGIGDSMREIDLRPARSEDYDFVFRLYVETMRPYTSAFFEWVDKEQADRFASLYRLQETVIILHDGAGIGWFAARESDSEISLLQFYIAPTFQRRGIGSQVLQGLLERWQLSGKPITLGVLKNNPARRFYERLGFSIAGENDLKFFMKRPTESGR